MKCIPFDIEEHLNIFISFLKQETANSKDPAAANMWADDWTELPNTLPYILTKTNKFTGSLGEFHILFDGDQIIGCGGVQIAHFNNRIALCGVRTWVLPKYRNRSLLKDLLLPVHKSWAIRNNCYQIALTFNDYNKNIMEIFKRNRAGTPRLEHNLFYNGIEENKYPVTIQQTPQWVIYEKLNPLWNFNWSILRA
jgi:hypothetical protein